MKWNIPIKKLKNLGYEFCKLFAMNYKMYVKKIDGRSLWLGVAGRYAEYDGFGGNEICDIMPFIQKIIDSEEYYLKSDNQFIHFWYNTIKGEVINKSYTFEKFDIPRMEEIVRLSKKGMDNDAIWDELEKNPELYDVHSILEPDHEWRLIETKKSTVDKIKAEMELIKYDWRVNNERS